MLLYILLILISVLTYTCLLGTYCIKIGQALQKDLPPAPLVTEAKKISLKLANHKLRTRQYKEKSGTGIEPDPWN